MNRALIIIIDVQNEYFSGKLPVKYPKNSFKNILKVMDFANESNIPIVLIQHTNSPEASTFACESYEWQIHPEVASRPYDVLIEKTFPDSFTDTNLGEWLKDQEIDIVTIGGYMTQMCCDTTARQAFHIGFDVEFLSDATGTLDVFNYAGYVAAEDLHRSILVTQAMKFSSVMSVEEWTEKILKKD